MAIRIAINGFGRIGRSVLRALYESGRRAEISVVAINELASAEGMAHLLKYDSSHGRFAWDVRQECDSLYVGDDIIRLIHQSEIEQLPWGELGIDVVLDCSGVYGSREDGEAHLASGAKKCCLPIPAVMIWMLLWSMVLIIRIYGQSIGLCPTPLVRRTALFLLFSCWILLMALNQALSLPFIRQ